MPWVYNPFTQRLDWTAAGGGGGLPAGITSPGDGALAAAAGTLTASRPSWDATQTWNAAGVTFTGWRLNITDTASAAASLLMSLQVGGSTRFSVDKNGVLSGPTVANHFGLPTVAVSNVLRSAIHVYGDGTGIGALFNSTNGNFGLVFSQSMPLSWSSSDGASGNASTFQTATDTQLRREGAGILAQRLGTNAQEKRIYGTFTDASNHRRVSMGMSTAGAGYLRPEGAGTGASGNTLQISTGAQTVASLPSASTAGAGARLFVTDANATTFAAVVAGGGSNGVPVYSDGTNWRIG